MTDIIQWGIDNNCAADPGYNDEKTSLTCMCSDGTTCTEIFGVKTGCPCPTAAPDDTNDTSNKYLGLPLWAWIVIGVGVVVAIIAGYYGYNYYMGSKVTTSKMVAENSDIPLITKEAAKVLNVPPDQLITPQDAQKAGITSSKGELNGLDYVDGEWKAVYN